MSKSPSIEYDEFINDRTGKKYKVPKGVDPAFAFNVGKTRGQNLQNFLAGKLEDADSKITLVALKDTVLSSIFEIIYKAKNLDIAVPVAVLSKSKANLLQFSIGASRVVLFSGYTAKKGKSTHKDIKQEDYLKVQWLIENGECTQDGENHLVFSGKVKENEYWKAVVKKTQKGNELYLQTLHRYREEQYKKKKK